MRALVTGGAGFIGSHLVSYLLKKKCKVTILDNLSTGHAAWVPEVDQLVVGDITTPEICDKTCLNQDYVFHLAAMSRVGSSLEKIEYCTRQNVVGTLNMLQASRKAGVQKFLYAGSSSYYGNQTPPHHEKLLHDCLNPYALTKYVGELYCQLFSQLYGLPTVVLRLFNVYGARQPKTGEDALVIGSFLHKKRHNEPLLIHGNGAIERDFVYVKDVAKIFWRLAQSDVSGEVINVGSGQKTAILDLAKMIGGEIHFGPRRLGDAQATLADVSKLTKVLGLLPMIPLKEGLQETWAEDYAR